MSRASIDKVRFTSPIEKVITNGTLAGGKRWTKGGKDRLYFNDIPYLASVYIDLETGILNAFCPDVVAFKSGLGSEWYSIMIGRIERGDQGFVDYSVDYDESTWVEYEMLDKEKFA